jgi:hypothetical protein
MYTTSHGASSSSSPQVDTRFSRTLLELRQTQLVPGSKYSYYSVDLGSEYANFTTANLAELRAILAEKQQFFINICFRFSCSWRDQDSTELEALIGFFNNLNLGFNFSFSIEKDCSVNFDVNSIRILVNRISNPRFTGYQLTLDNLGRGRAVTPVLFCDTLTALSQLERVTDLNVFNYCDVSQCDFESLKMALSRLATVAGLKKINLSSNRFLRLGCIRLSGILDLFERQGVAAITLCRATEEVDVGGDWTDVDRVHISRRLLNLVFRGFKDGESFGNIDLITLGLSEAKAHEMIMRHIDENPDFVQNLHTLCLSNVFLRSLPTEWLSDKVEAYARKMDSSMISTFVRNLMQYYPGLRRLSSDLEMEGALTMISQCKGYIGYCFDLSSLSYSDAMIARFNGLSTRLRRPVIKINLTEQGDAELDAIVRVINALQLPNDSELQLRECKEPEFGIGRIQGLIRQTRNPKLTTG